MSHEERMKELFNLANNDKERMFPILNKIGKIWEDNATLQFCELVKLIVLDSKTDLEFTQHLDTYIDERASD